MEPIKHPGDQSRADCNRSSKLSILKVWAASASSIAACNCGGYSLVASDLGAHSFGFDVRDRWIRQAQFLKRHFGKSDDEVR